MWADFPVVRRVGGVKIDKNIFFFLQNSIEILFSFSFSFFLNQITFSTDIVLPACSHVLTVVHLSITVGAMFTHFIPL